MNRSTAALVLVLLVAHALLTVRAFGHALARDDAADFASYHYAAAVALEGGDPYDVDALSRAARDERTRGRVHPYFYPPPFLLLVAWAPSLELATAYRIWFWLSAASALLCALVLWRWWRPLGPAVPVALAATLAALTAIPNNHLMGQANLPVLLFVLAGLSAEARGRPWLGGALVGTACMLKMSPALFVAWWLLRGRFAAVASACLTAVALSVAVLPLVGPDRQWAFYTDVLPGFASGDYHGLAVPIGLFGNHSIPNLWHQAFPGSGSGLSDAAALGARISNLALVAGLALWLRPPPGDLLARAGQVGAVGVAMLLVPVYTYEHHVVFAIPAAVAAVVAWWRGRLGRWWALALLPALAAWAMYVGDAKAWWQLARTDWPVLAFAIREAKFAALVVLLLASARIGRSR